MYDDILFPTDGETGADAGFERAVAAAETFGARLHVLYVADTTRDSVTTVGGDVVDVLEQEGEEIVDEYVDRAKARGIDAVDAVIQGQPHDIIVEYAEANADLVIMPTSGREGVAEHLLGSTTERVVRTCSVPVLTLPAG
ncbi:universal stress protein [Natronomonas marina]|jgi:nucleotide-binding universal stress UspA family protein|uniref:universal stress protein n=1 Tax=Natronomonas marina TaxID=2961939 RepID=UPI0020C9C194|nr:universal stress protein [Natronomonas marina]